MIETLPEVLEQKYNFAASSFDELVEWMAYALDADPVHPEGVVNSLYYDTPDLELYHQKRASEYLKFKVRLRWYGDAEADAASETRCYLEVKRKVGSMRRKQRTTTKLCTRVLAGANFDCPEISDLAELALENHYPRHAPLVPMAHIRYRRMRFVDPATGARIALDWDIGCRWFNRAFIPLEPPIWLDRGVIEVKGRMRHLPESLEATAFLLHKNSFSKYAACLEKLMYPEGVRI